MPIRLIHSRQQLKKAPAMSKQKIWFITGASRGFGARWAEAALKRGDKVVATARDPKALNDLAATYGEAVLTLQIGRAHV